MNIIHVHNDERGASVVGCMVAMVVITVWYIPKAILEAVYFKDRHDAKQSLFRWILSVGSIGLALCFALLIDYLG